MKRRSWNLPQERSSKENEIGRRDFGRIVALALAGSTVADPLMAAAGSEVGGIPRLAFRTQEQNQAHLSSAAQAEVEAKLRHIFETYGGRLNDDQKKMMRRTVSEHVRMLEAIRPIHEANGDSPATVLKLIRGAAPDYETRSRRQAAKTDQRNA